LSGRELLATTLASGEDNGSGRICDGKNPAGGANSIDAATRGEASIPTSVSAKPELSSFPTITSSKFTFLEEKKCRHGTIGQSVRQFQSWWWTAILVIYVGLFDKERPKWTIKNNNQTTMGKSESKVRTFSILFYSVF
jgi:hypothetical protein